MLLELKEVTIPTLNQRRIIVNEVTFGDDIPVDRSELKPGTYEYLSVSDTGQGMSPEIIEQIFNPFFTTKKVGKGTGMGLSVVHGIISEHGGVIDVTSVPGEGASFFVSLPLANSGVVKQDA